MQKQNQNILIIATFVVLIMIASPANAAIESLIKLLEENNTPKLKAYNDGTNTPTIGFGSIYNYDLNRPVEYGDIINEEQAYRYMRIEIDQLTKDIKGFVTYYLNTNQLAALVSLGYNIGSTALKNSTLVKLLNAKADINAIADQFLVWNKSKNQNTGLLEFNQGLYNRRIIERDLFLS
jgi:lysozyme